MSLQTQPADAPSIDTLRAGRPLLEAMRTSHWIKNAFVLAPILFSRRYDEPLAWLYMAPAVIAFCLLSSAVYLINDVRDRQADLAHPVKRNRPIASGRLGAGAAITWSAVLAIAGLALASSVAYLHLGGFPSPQPSAGHTPPLGGLGLPVWAAVYFGLNIAYSFKLKHYNVVDVLVVAIGFVLRAMAGAAAISVPVSPWLVVCTLSLCLYIALAKRRGEVADLGAGQAAQARAVNRSYDPRDLEHMIAVSASMALLTYSIYCLAPSTIQHVGSAHMVWTIPLVVYGMFRYNRITRQVGQGDPTAALARDRGMWFVLLAFVALTALVQKFGATPFFRTILELPK